MAELFSTFVKGYSGNQYNFDLYTLDSIFPDLPGVYIFVKVATPITVDSDCEILYVGESSSLKERINQYHEKWNLAINIGMNAIGILIQVDKVTRKSIENDIVRAHSPPLNITDV